MVLELVLVQSTAVVQFTQVCLRALVAADRWPSRQHLQLLLLSGLAKLRIQGAEFQG